MRAGFALCAINSHLSAGILTYETSITYINCFSQRQYGHLQKYGKSYYEKLLWHRLPFVA